MDDSIPCEIQRLLHQDLRSQLYSLFSLSSLFETITVPVTFFLVPSPVSKTIAYFALVLRASYTAAFAGKCQYNFEQITASFSAGRR